MEPLRMEPMTEPLARQIAGWRYDGDYALYDHNPEHIQGFLDGTHFAALDGQGGLVGYFCFGADARIPTVEEDVYAGDALDIGLGMRPDLCGKGLGLDFLRQGMAYGGALHQTSRLRLSVAAFNRRAIKVYQRAGFTIRQEVTNSYSKKQFYIMTCGA